MLGTTTFFTHSCFTSAYGKCSGCSFIHSGGLRQGKEPEPPLPAISRCCFWQLFWFSVSPLSLCGISHTLMHRCSMLILLPPRHVFMIEDSQGQPYPTLALNCREQQKDVSVAALLKTWASICILQYIVRCRYTQLSFLSHTGDLVMDLFWLKSSGVSVMPSIKKLNCILKLS